MITRELLKVLRSDINAALAQVAKKHKLSKLDIGNITFDSHSFRTKVEGFAQASKNAEVQRTNLGLLSLGFTEKGLTKPFVFNGAKFKLVDVRRTRVVILKLENSKQYTARIDSVMRVIRRDYPSMLSKAHR